MSTNKSLKMSFIVKFIQLYSSAETVKKATVPRVLFFSQNPKYNGFKNNCKIEENYLNQLVRNSMAVDLI